MIFATSNIQLNLRTKFEILQDNVFILAHLQSCNVHCRSVFKTQVRFTSDKHLPHFFFEIIVVEVEKTNVPKNLCLF